MRRPRGRDVAAARLLGASLVLVGLAACSTRAPVDPLAAVEALIRCGSHDCLTRALGLAQELHRRLPERADVRDDAVRAALLLALRERQLGIVDDSPLAAARDLLEPCDDCRELHMLASEVELVRTHAGGVHEDLSRSGIDWQRRESIRMALARWRVEQQERLRTDPAVAALCLGLALPRRPGGEPPRVEPGKGCAGDAHPKSPLVLFSRAVAKGGGLLQRGGLCLQRRPEGPGHGPGRAGGGAP